MKKRTIVQIILFLAFFGGGIKLAGFSLVLTKYIIEGLILSFFLFSILRFGNRKIPLLKEFIFLSFAVFLSTYYSNDFNFGSLTFYRKLIVPYMLFISVYLNRFSKRDVHKINRTIYFLFIVQIIAAFPKLIIIGPSEKYVGTISVTGGSLNNSLPLMALIFLWSIHLFNKRKIPKFKFYLLVVGFLFFAFTGVKRAFWIFLPVIMLIGTLIYNYLIFKRPFVISKIFIRGFVGVLIIAMGISLNPYFNEDKKIGGEVNFEYFRDYSITYNFYDERKGGYRGRFGGNYQLVSDLFFESNYIIFKKKSFSWLMGFGPSSFYNDNYLMENDNIDIKFRSFIPTGFFRMLFTCGIIGVIAFLLFYTRIVRFLIKEIKQRFKEKYNKFGKIVLFSLLIYSIFIVLEFIIYSNTYGSYLIFPYFYFLAIVYRNNSYILKNEQK